MVNPKNKTKIIMQNPNDDQISNEITTTHTKGEGNIQKTRLNQEHGGRQSPDFAHSSTIKTNNKKANYLSIKYQTNYTCITLAVLFSATLAACGFATFKFVKDTKAITVCYCAIV